MSEYIIDMGKSSYQSTSGLLCADVSQLREEIVRCRDCKWFLQDDDFQHGCRWFCRKLDRLDGFCSWGERKEDA